MKNIDFTDFFNVFLSGATILREVIPDAAIVTHPYTDPEAFYREMQDADGLLTAFISLDKTALDRMPTQGDFH